MERIIFKDGNIVSDNGIRRGSVIVEDGEIAGVVFSVQPDGTQGKVVDCAGKYIGPGFVDIHVHGGSGRDFLAKDTDGLIEGINYHFENGVTAITPACLSVPFEEIGRSIGLVKEIKDKAKSTVLGFHVEGVYLDRKYRGGHLGSYVHAPNPGEYMPLIEKYGDFITEWTLAPELKGAMDLIKICAQNGIVTSVGHSRASYDVLMKAIDAGLTHSTHFACVMGNLRFERLGESTGKGFAPGVLETVLLDDRLTTELIADGCHLHKGLIQLAVKCKGVDKVCIVSDAMMGAGLPDGDYVIGGQDCIVRHNLAVIKDRPEVIASSVTPVIGMLRHLVKNCGIPLHNAWTMCSLTPAKIIGADRKKGSLRAGRDADILIMDKDLNIRSIFAKGTLHEKS
jgi:N-acetylglucosamine-6-phosphate deacetylase